MDFRERLYAVLRHEAPDRVPFGPQDNHLHRGQFERELRNRGVGLYVKTVPLIRAEMPHVSIETTTADGTRTTTYHTPVGSVYTSTLSRSARESAAGGSAGLDGMIKSADDYAPVLFMIEDTTYRFEHVAYESTLRDLGGDGVIRLDGFGPAYGESRGYYGSIYGLERWIYAQHDEPERFTKLVEALERRKDRLGQVVLDCPADLIMVGSVNGDVSPAWWEKWNMPFYDEYVPKLMARHKHCILHAHASNLASFAKLIQRTGCDVIEAFTPPPIGNLSLRDARRAWGRDVVIWINFPESIFYEGTARTKQYMTDLLLSDPPGDRLAVGFTEMGQSGIHDEESERIFTAGIRAVMEAIEEHGNYPIG